MVASVDRWLGRFSVTGILASSVALLGVIVAFDYFTEAPVSYSLLYLFPIFLISWRLSRAAGVATALVCAVVWAYLDYTGSPAWNAWRDLWNVAMKVGIFVSFAIVVSRVKKDVVEQMRLNAEVTSALAQVRQLSGLLPICAWCKKIRDKDGKWYPIEAYVVQHTEADFSHGICPDCAASRHPAFRA